MNEPNTDVRGVVVLCGDCGTEGPERPRSMAAREAAREAGWSRCYRGSGEVWRCPSCRNGGVS